MDAFIESCVESWSRWDLKVLREVEHLVDAFVYPCIDGRDSPIARVFDNPSVTMAKLIRGPSRPNMPRISTALPEFP